MTNLKVYNLINANKKEMNEKIAKGLCLFCDEQWDRCHRHKCKLRGKLCANFWFTRWRGGGRLN